MSVTSILTRQTEAPVRRGDHVRDDLHEYTVDTVADHLADSIGEHVLSVHDDDGNRFTVFASEVVRCGRHRRLPAFLTTRTLARAGRRLRAAGYKTIVKGQHPHRMLAVLHRGPLRAMVSINTGIGGPSWVHLVRSGRPGQPELVLFENTRPGEDRDYPFTVDDAVRRAVALAREIGAVTR